MKLKQMDAIVVIKRSNFFFFLAINQEEQLTELSLACRTGNPRKRKEGERIPIPVLVCRSCGNLLNLSPVQGVYRGVLCQAELQVAFDSVPGDFHPKGKTKKIWPPMRGEEETRFRCQTKGEESL